LILEVFQRALLQPGLGVDEVPVHAAFGLCVGFVGSTLVDLAD
jgi:hypothetical protein